MRMTDDDDPQTTLDRLNRSKPLDKLQKYNYYGVLTRHYKARLRLQQKVKDIQSAHREVFFGDCADMPVWPVLPAIFKREVELI